MYHHELFSRQMHCRNYTQNTLAGLSDFNSAHSFNAAILVIKIMFVEKKADVWSWWTSWWTVMMSSMMTLFVWAKNQVTMARSLLPALYSNNSLEYFAPCVVMLHNNYFTMWQISVSQLVHKSLLKLLDCAFDGFCAKCPLCKCAV